MKRGSVLLIIGAVLVLYAIFFGQKTVEVIGTMFKPKYAGTASPYDDLINFHAAANGVDPLLIRAIIRQESNWDPNVMGFDGLSVGLMQITLPLAKDYLKRDSSFEELANPETSIMIGAWYIGRMVAKYGLEGGIASYNEGPGNWLKGKKDAVYVDSVMAFYKQYQDAAANA